MAKFECKKCNKKMQLRKSTLIIKDGKIVVKESLCDCGEYMKEVKTKFDGFPNIIRNE